MRASMNPAVSRAARLSAAFLASYLTCAVGTYFLISWGLLGRSGLYFVSFMTLMAPAAGCGVFAQARFRDTPHEFTTARFLRLASLSLLVSMALGVFLQRAFGVRFGWPEVAGVILFTLLWLERWTQRLRSPAFTDESRATVAPTQVPPAH